MIDKYNYNSIKSFIENGNHSNRKILDYIYRLIMDISSAVHNKDWRGSNAPHRYSSKNVSKNSEILPMEVNILKKLSKSFSLNS